MIKQMNLKFGNYFSHVTLANNDKTDIYRVWIFKNFSHVTLANDDKMILAMLFLPVMTKQTNLEFGYDFSHVTLANNDNCYSPT